MSVRPRGSRRLLAPVAAAALVLALVPALAGPASASGSTDVKPLAAPRLTVKTKPDVVGQVGFKRTIVAYPGVWSAKPSSFSYQWLRNGTAIKDATKQRYTAQVADLGKNLAVKVTAKRSGYTSGSYTTGQTDSVRGQSELQFAIASASGGKQTFSGRVAVPQGAPVATGNVRVTIKNKPLDVKLSSTGTYTGTLSLAAGTHSLLVSYAGTAGLTQYETTRTVTVGSNGSVTQSRDTDAALNFYNETNKGGIKIGGSVTGPADTRGSGKVKVTIGSFTKEYTLSNGLFSGTANIPVGRHKVVVAYSGGGAFNGATTRREIVVKDAPFTTGK